MSNQNWLQRFFARKPDQQEISRPATLSQAETRHISAETSTTAEQRDGSDQRVQAAIAPPASEEALAAVPALWQIGDVILNQYEVIDKLGEGGMGTVYKVRHHGWDIDLAVKSPRPETFATEQGKINFTHEAETWVNLQLHPHIVACYYVRILGGIPRVFAEYVADGNLADWIRRRRLYRGGHEQALERMLDAAIQFAWGLHAAHEQGLIHQDIKPANVMLTPEGIVKVTDFGLARARSLADEPLNPPASGSQSVLVSARGMTPAYCSPEQAKGEALSRRTDIWSWGVSVLEMFTGEVTWYSGALARDVLASYDSPDDAAIPPMPKAVMLLLARCFEQLPENRPATMLAVATELQAIYADEVGQPYPRKMPQMAEMLADSLNNRALSLSNMGKLVESQQLWEQALQADPRHLETTYNRGVLLWREGKLSDDALVKQLEVVRNAHDPRWQASYLLAQVHLERGDRNTALPLLEEAAKQAPTALEVQQLYRKVRAEKIADKRDPLKLEGHSSVVYAVDISADGRVAISSEANSVRIWDVDTGRCLHVLQEKEIWPVIKVVGLSADGRLAISAQGKKIWLWDVPTGRRLRTLQQRGEVMKASLSASGELIISGDGNSAHIWDTRTGRTLHTLQHPHEVQAVGLSADGRLAVTSSGFLPPRGVKGKENTLQLWDAGTGRCVLTLEQAGGGVDAVSLSADKRLLAANIAGAIHVWETSTGRSLHILRAHTHNAHSLRLSADGRWLVSGSPDRTARLWDLKVGRCVCTQHHSEWIWGVGISADGRRIISGGGDNMVRVWGLDQQRMLCPLHPSQVFSHTDVTQAKSQAERLLEQFEQAYAEKHFAEALTLLRELRSLPGWERRPECMDAWARLTPHCERTGFRAAWLTQTFQIGARAVNLNADGQLAAFASGESVQVWEMSEGRCLHNLQGHTGEVNTVSLSKDTRWIASGSSDKTIRLWDRSNGRCLQVLQGHTDSVMTVDMSGDSKLIVSSGHDGYIRIWEATTGRCLRVLDAALGERGVDRWIYRVSISADGCLLLSGGYDSAMRVWEVSTGRSLHVLKEHLGPVTSVNITEDGQFAISGGNEPTFSGSGDRAICIWEVSTGRCLRVIKANFGLQHDVNISPDGRWIVSGGANQLVQLWETNSGRCLCTLQDHTAWVHSVCLSADGNWLLSAAYDGTMRLWALDWELEVRKRA
ncbi:MAG TPA: protein kinase [Ktedonobacteraceae bacterium]|nr:protein kinase [Ktedonobacteraceae bacterium]